MKKIVFLVLMFGIAQTACAAEVKLLCSGGGAEFVVTFDPAKNTIEGQKAYKRRTVGPDGNSYIIDDNQIQIYYGGNDKIKLTINRLTGSFVADTYNPFGSDDKKNTGQCTKAQQAF